MNLKFVFSIFRLATAIFATVYCTAVYGQDLDSRLQQFGSSTDITGLSASQIADRQALASRLTTWVQESGAEFSPSLTYPRSIPTLILSGLSDESAETRQRRLRAIYEALISTFAGQEFDSFRITLVSRTRRLRSGSARPVFDIASTETNNYHPITAEL